MQTNFKLKIILAKNFIKSCFNKIKFIQSLLTVSTAELKILNHNGNYNIPLNRTISNNITNEELNQILINYINLEQHQNYSYIYQSSLIYIFLNSLIFISTLFLASFFIYQLFNPEILQYKNSNNNNIQNILLNEETDNLKKLHLITEEKLNSLKIEDLIKEFKIKLNSIQIEEQEVDFLITSDLKSIKILEELVVEFEYKLNLLKNNEIITFKDAFNNDNYQIIENAFLKIKEILPETHISRDFNETNITEICKLLENIVRNLNFQSHKSYFIEQIFKKAMEKIANQSINPDFVIFFIKDIKEQGKIYAKIRGASGKQQFLDNFIAETILPLFSNF